MSLARAPSFGAWADEYDRWRPAYPAAAVDWLLPPGCASQHDAVWGAGKPFRRPWRIGPDPRSPLANRPLDRLKARSGNWSGL